MKKSILFLVLFLMVIGRIPAQNYEALKSFLVKYSDNYDSECFGQTIPTYHFNDELNSEKLIGKVVILDFWATWCSACHLLSGDLDSLLVRAQFVKNYQLIGVNYKESKHEKTPAGTARTYWEKNGNSFPMVEGKEANRIGDRLGAGHPTLILVDGEGIIRGRWNSYTPGTVSMVHAATWIITHPDEKYDKEFLFGTYRNKAWPLALFTAEQLKEDEEVFWVKLKALLHVSEWDAWEYVKAHYDAIDVEQRKSKAYEEKLWNIMGEIAEAEVLSLDLNKFGIKLFEELCDNFEGYSDDYVVLDYVSRLYWRTGQKDKARECNAKCLEICKKMKVDPSTIEYFNRVAQKYLQ